MKLSLPLNGSIDLKKALRKTPWIWSDSYKLLRAFCIQSYLDSGLTVSLKIKDPIPFNRPIKVIFKG